MQHTAIFSKALAVGDFRRDLRGLERELMRQLEGETACRGVTLAQCHALLELSFSELSLSGLAAAVDLDTSTLSRTVEGLVKAGLVKRTQDLADRRSVRLVLSAAGRAKVATIDEMCNRYYTELFEQLGEKDQRCVIRAVSLLAHLMRSRRCAGSRNGCKGVSK
jgi:MarR family transcriptional regulator for hemolysin